MIEITQAREDGLETILSVEREAISPPWSEGALLSEIGHPDAFFAVAEEDGETLGFILLHRCADEAELYQIAVKSGARRRGIADALLKAGFTWCRQNHFAAVWLEVRKSNAPAIGLYRRAGFLSEGKRKNYYTDPVEDAVVMVLKLN